MGVYYIKLGTNRDEKILVKDKDHLMILMNKINKYLNVYFLIDTDADLIIYVYDIHIY